MVVGVADDVRTDRIFQALADATRRDIVLRTLTGEHSVSDLARQANGVKDVKSTLQVNPSR